MLGEAYRWIDSVEGSYLQLRAGCVARVKAVPPDRWGCRAHVEIFEFRQVSGPAPSIMKGKLWVEAYLEGRSPWIHRGPPKRWVGPKAVVRVRTPEEIHEWQRREAELSVRLMRAAGWREPPAEKAPDAKYKPRRNWSWSP